ncbi:MAG: Flp family type IVb pilin [Acidimicrobiia bacterium]
MKDQASTLPTRVFAAFHAFTAQERGASMVEYAFLVALIAIAAFAAVALMGTALGEEYETISRSVQEAGSGGG